MRVVTGGKPPQKTYKVAWVLLAAFLLWVVVKSNGFWDGINSEPLIQEMRLVGHPVSGMNQENLDAVVLKHIPLGTSADTVLEICKVNGFKFIKRNSDMRGSEYPDFDEHIYCSMHQMHWFLIASDEYRVILYLKNERVGAVIGRYFLHAI